MVLHARQQTADNRAPGASIKLWWDTCDSPLGDALAPLCETIDPLVDGIKGEIEDSELLQQRQD